MRRGPGEPEKPWAPKAFRPLLSFFQPRYFLRNEIQSCIFHVPSTEEATEFRLGTNHRPLKETVSKSYIGYSPLQYQMALRSPAYSFSI